MVSKAFGLSKIADSDNTLYVDSSNNRVGIGNTSPSEQLHITGNLRIGSAVAETPSGSAPLAFCRAWVNANGAGTVSVRASYNVSSITDNGSGDYTINFTTTMPDANYSATFGLGYTRTSSSGGTYARQAESVFALSSNSAFRFFTGQQYSPYSLGDSEYMTVSIIR